MHTLAVFLSTSEATKKNVLIGPSIQQRPSIQIAPTNTGFHPSTTSAWHENNEFLIVGDSSGDSWMYPYILGNP